MDKTPTPRELAGVIMALATGSTVSELTGEQLGVFLWACERAAWHPEEVQTIGDTAVPPGSPETLYTEEE